MKIDILTLFPEMFKGVFEHSILARAQKKGLIKINIYNLRNWANNKHHTIDDTPYGGGAGMVLKVDVIDRAIASLKRKIKNEKCKIILLTPRGKIFNQKKALQLSKNKRLILVSGHYEGFDERVKKLVDEEISIGNYILTGGEIPAMVLVDSISRLVPEVINPESLKHESFSSQPTTNLPRGKAGNYQLSTRDKKTVESCKLTVESYLEFPHYTRPEIYKPISIKTKKNLRVPKVLLSGNHAEIAKWRSNKRKLTKNIF